MSDDAVVTPGDLARAARDAWVATNQAPMMAGMHRDAVAAGAQSLAYIDAEDAHDLAVALAQLAMLTPEAALEHTVGIVPALMLDPPPVAVARGLAVAQLLDRIIAQAFRAHAEQDPHIYPDGSRA